MNKISNSSYDNIDYFKKNNYFLQQCTQCCLRFWSKKKSAFCGDAQCNNKKIKKFETSFSNSEIHSFWKNYWVTSKVEKGLNCQLLPRSATTLKTSTVNFMIAGISAFERFTHVETPIKLLEKYNKTYINTQFCFRFNDLQNVEKTFRHNTGFHMLGVHAFETKKNKFGKNWKSEIIKNITDFLLGLGFKAEEIYYHADYWTNKIVGGPCIEIFYDGIELGNIVFINGDIPDEEVSEENMYLKPNRILDVGLGLDRISKFFSKDAEEDHLLVRDHLKTYLVGIKDGITPSKTGSGYNFRKLIERCEEYILSTDKPVNIKEILENTAEKLEKIYTEENFSKYIEDLFMNCTVQE